MFRGGGVYFHCNVSANPNSLICCVYCDVTRNYLALSLVRLLLTTTPKVPTMELSSRASPI